jgi:RNA polymerase sigma factor (sigma-70 family)
MNESNLVQAFRRERSEAAFAELVRRYAGLVYTVAKRRVNNGSLAEDITQLVFIRLAKSPPDCTSDAELAAWLHRTAINVAIDAWRSETRRREREKKVLAMETPAPENQIESEILPKLDEALDQLDHDDRHALLLRFYGKKAMREVGIALGVSEDAAKMRVSRAIGKLRAQLGIGTICSVAVLATLLAERSVEAAPSQLVSRLAALKLPVPAGVESLGGISRFKFVCSAIGIVMATALIIHLLHPSTAILRKKADGLTTKTVEGVASSNKAGLNAAEIKPAESMMTFRVVDAQTGTGIRDARIHAYNLAAGWLRESRDLLTDTNGNAPLPNSTADSWFFRDYSPTEDTKGLSIFVVAEKYVPTQVLVPKPTDYTIKLDRAANSGGWVMDEEGFPVAGVQLAIQTPGHWPGHEANIDFQRCLVTNREDGSWSYPYVPVDYTNEIQFVLKKPGYAGTMIKVPVSQVNLTNLILVIEHGFSITGHVLDSQKKPIANARIKLLHHDLAFQ